MGGIDYKPSKRFTMKWARPTPARVEFISNNVRKQDEREVFYSHGITGKEAVLASWKQSEICCCIDGDNDLPVGICGVNNSLIWLLGTEELFSTSSHRRQFIRGGRKWVDGLISDGNDFLHNWALYSNATSIRWLKHLGFTVDTPAPMGQNAQLFSHFWRKA